MSKNTNQAVQKIKEIIATKRAVVKESYASVPQEETAPNTIEHTEINGEPK